MTVVRIIKNWHNPDVWHQTPGSSGIWRGIKFTEDNVPSDYVIVLNTPMQPVTVDCPGENIWLMVQEPPNEVYGWLHKVQRGYARVYTTDPDRNGKPYIHSQPALPWHVAKDYDHLKQVKPPQKEKKLSWITSTKSRFAGHRERMAFLDNIKETLSFDLFGRGFNPITDKWDGLAPYRYSLAIENFTSPYYWTEKIADCFLAWTMPIYFGCTAITNFFPRESMVLIDIHDQAAPERIKEAIESDLWKKNMDAIEDARNKILDEYQLFPFLSREIEKQQNQSPRASRNLQITLQPAKKPVNHIDHLKDRFRKYPFFQAFKRFYKSIFRK